jgi:hypothetical protein
MFRKRPLHHDVLINLEVDEAGRDVRPRTSTECDGQAKEIEERSCSPSLILPIESSEDRCSTPIQSGDTRCSTPPIFPIKSIEARTSEDRCSTPIRSGETRCCTPPTFSIKSIEAGCCTPLTFPMNPRDFKRDNIPLAPIRETLIARPSRFINSDQARRRSWAVSVGTGNLENVISIERIRENM